MTLKQHENPTGAVTATATPAVGEGDAAPPAAPPAPPPAAPAAGVGRARAALRATRPHQWAKNLLLLIPLLLAHRVGDWARASAGAFAFCSFCLCASAVYVFNDLMDLEADRRHPTKSRRPFAAGTLSVRFGIVMGSVLLAASFALAAVVNRPFVAMLAVYFALTCAYSLWLKRKMLVDVIVLASLYTHRIIAGAYAVDVPLTMWLLAFSMFLFLSLAFVKRYGELLALEKAGGWKATGRNYQVTDLRVIEGVGPAAGYLAVLVFCNYLDSPLVKKLYRQPQVMWLICPILLYWVTRLWFLARRGWMHEDPVLFALRDRISIIAGVTIAAIVLAASAPLPAWWPF